MRHLSFFIAFFILTSIESQTLKPDSTYALTGKLNIENKIEIIISIGIDSDGDIYYLGGGYDFSSDTLSTFLSMFKSQPDGKIFTDFGDNGYNNYQIKGWQFYSVSLKIQKDGKILILGNGTLESENKIVVIRYNQDGSFDKSFGENGILLRSLSNYYYSTDMHEVADGKLVIVGSKNISDDKYNLSLLRLNADGSTDNSYGNNGEATIEYVDPAYAIEEYTSVLQSDNKIVIGGYLNVEDEFEKPFITRIMSDGSLDTEFGIEGFFVLSDTEGKEFNHVSLQSDGKILFAGTHYIETMDDYKSILLAGRLNVDGSLDNSFGDSGYLKIDPIEHQFLVGYSIKEYVGNRIMIAGSSYEIQEQEQNADIFIMELDENGNMNTSFGNGGIFTDDFEGNFDNLYGMTFDEEERILVYGESLNFNTDSKALMARYIPDLKLGKIDFENLNAAVFTYPNPVISDCTLEFELLNDESISLDILSSNGTLVKKVIINEKRSSGVNTQLIPVEGLNSGMYILALRSGDKVINTKIIKQ